MALNISTVSSKRKWYIAIPEQKVLNCRQCVGNLSLRLWSSVCLELVIALFGDWASGGSRWGKEGGGYLSKLDPDTASAMRIVCFSALLQERKLLCILVDMGQSTLQSIWVYGLVTC